MSVSRKNYIVTGWLICGLGALFYAYEYILRILPSLMELSLRDHYNLSATGFGLLAASYYYAYVPLQLPVGVLMDRFGPRRLLTFACGLCVVGSLIFANTNSVNIAALGRFLVGFGSAFGFVGVLKLATIWLPENKLALAAGTAAALGTIGGHLSNNFLGSLVEQTSWKVTVDWSAYVGIGLMIILWLGIRDKRNHKQGGTIHNFKRSLQDAGLILMNPQMWINGIYGCLVYLPTTVFAELWGNPYLQYAHELSSTAAHHCIGLLFLGFTIGAPTMGYISDKIRRRKLPMFLGAVSAAIVMSIIVFVPGLTEKSLGSLLFILGLCYGSQAIVFAVGREISPKEAGGTAVATTNMLVMLGAIFLQPLVGRLLDYSVQLHSTAVDQTLSQVGQHIVYSAADYKFAVSLIPIGIGIAAILTFFLKETHGHTER